MSNNDFGGKDILLLVSGFFFIPIFSATLGFIPVWALWNWLVPDIFGAGSISLFQSFGLMLLGGFIISPFTPVILANTE